jgi:hypothetical protein
MTEAVIQEAVDTSVPQVLIDVDEVPSKPAPAADEKKTETGEVVKPPVEETPEQQEVKKESRRQRAIRRERDARVAAETRAEIAERQLAEAKAAKPVQQDGEPQRDQFEDYETYLRAVTKYDAKQEAAATLKAASEANQGKERQNQQTAAQQETAKNWGEREKAVIGTDKSYEADVTPYVEEALGDLADGTRRLIVDSEVGPQLLVHLARNPDVHDRISGLSPLRQIAELAKIEATFEGATAAATATETAPVSKKVSTAPAPIKPLNGTASTQTGYRENMTAREYSDWKASVKH